MQNPLDAVRPRSSSSEAIRRILAGMVFIPLFYVLVHDLGPMAFFGLVTIAALLALWEFYRLHVGPASWPWWGWVGLAFTGLLKDTRYRDTLDVETSCHTFPVPLRAHTGPSPVPQITGYDWKERRVG